MNKLIPSIILNYKKEWEFANIFDTTSFYKRIQFWVKLKSLDKAKKDYDAPKFDLFSEIVEDFDVYPQNKPQCKTKNKTNQNHKV